MNPVRTVAAFVLCVPLVAQTPAPQEPPRPDDARVEQRAQEMRDTIDAGRPVQSHVRVAVRLKNGNKLLGVVKDGRMVERVDGLRFVEAQAKDRGAGVRLWYSSGARNYVFVPFADFAEYEILQRLSQKQLSEIENEMQMNERRAAERAAEQAAKAAGEAVPPAAPGQETAPVDAAQQPGAKPAGGADKGKAAAGKEAAPTKEQEQQRQWFALLQAYPPAAGWGKLKRDEIARRFVVIGSKPSETEQKFVDQYAEWEKACKHFGIDPTEGDKKAAEKTGAKAGEKDAEKDTEKPKTGRGKAGKTGKAGKAEPEPDSDAEAAESTDATEESPASNSPRSRKKK